ncbi:beta-ketoacyl-ACP synthase II [Rickettsiales bacterium LUAb2]
MRRVVVTGIGIVSPLGLGIDHVWQQLIDGKSGLNKIQNFDIDESGLPAKVAAEIPLGDIKDGKFNIADWGMTANDARKMDKFIIYGIVAAMQAVQDSGIDNLSEQEKEDIGVNIGSGIGGLEKIYDSSNLIATENGHKRLTPFFIPSALINLTAGHVSMKYGFRGPNVAYATACSTGAHSIGDAFWLIKNNKANAMVAGGSEGSICKLGIAGFTSMKALSTKFNDEPVKASRPWDKERDGFVMGEGAGILVLEELEHAQKRGAKIYGEIVGFGMSGDANHITSPHPEGKGAALCMQRALDDANLNYSDINYINAHGTSTPLGDVAEVMAMKSVFKDHAKNLVVSSTKSSVGHLLGAAGAVEAIFCIKSTMDNIVPPTLNLDNPSEGCDLDFAPHKAKKVEVNYALSNSFGFGGTNAALIFKKYTK